VTERGLGPTCQLNKKIKISTKKVIIFLFDAAYPPGHHRVIELSRTNTVMSRFFDPEMLQKVI
jgi:hypothetical protein